jgi:hypothetical protein
MIMNALCVSVQAIVWHKIEGVTKDVVAAILIVVSSQMGKVR